MASRRRTQFWLAVLGAWLVWGALYAIYLRGVKEGTHLQVLHYAFSDALLWALVTPLVWWLARRFPVGAPHLVRHLFVHAVLAPTVAGTVLFLDALQDQVFRPEGGWTLAEYLAHAIPYRLHSNLILYASLVAIGHWLDYQGRLRESERSVEALRAHLAEARLQVLHSQLRPHFLFNCLNTISGLVESHPERARGMIGQLAELLRLALRTPPEETIPLRDELRFVRAYLDLEQARYGERLKVELDVPDSCADLLVPPILLQPLVENAVRHGLAPLPEGGRVLVRARVRGGRAELRVDDDGVGIETTRNGSAGIGLSSVRARLEALYGDDHSFDVGPGAAGGTRIDVSIPNERWTSGPGPAG